MNKWKFDTSIFWIKKNPTIEILKENDITKAMSKWLTSLKLVSESLIVSFCSWSQPTNDVLLMGRKCSYTKLLFTNINSNPWQWFEKNFKMKNQLRDISVKCFTNMNSNSWQWFEKEI